MLKAFPAYLAGTARRWYTSTFSSNQAKPTTYAELKAAMIADLCPADYLSQQLQQARQMPGQPSINFIYEIQELSLRIDENTPEVFIVSMAKEKIAASN